METRRSQESWAAAAASESKRQSQRGEARTQEWIGLLHLTGLSGGETKVALLLPLFKEFERRGNYSGTHCKSRGRQDSVNGIKAEAGALSAARFFTQEPISRINAPMKDSEYFFIFILLLWVFLNFGIYHRELRGVIFSLSPRILPRSRNIWGGLVNKINKNQDGQHRERGRPGRDEASHHAAEGAHARPHRAGGEVCHCFGEWLSHKYLLDSPTCVPRSSPSSKAQSTAHPSPISRVFTPFVSF